MQATQWAPRNQTQTYQQPLLGTQQQQQPYNQYQVYSMPQQQQAQQQAQAPVQSAGHPQLDPKVQQQYMSFLHHATAAQFKPIKLYVLFNDPTSVSCIQMVRGNTDLDRQVEVVDAAPTGNRPKWLKGVPSLMDEKGQFFLGSECVMWIRYQASQSLAGVNETTGTAQISSDAPDAIDGAASLTGALGMASFVPQQLIADRDLMQTIDGNKAAQRFDQFMVTRQQMPIIAPPPGGGGQFGHSGGGGGVQPPQFPEQYQTQSVGRGGSAEK